MTIIISILVILAVIALMVITMLALFGVISIATVSWKKLGKWSLVAIVVIIAITITVNRWNQPSAPALATVTASDPYDWEIVVMIKNEMNEQHHKTRLVSRTVNRVASQMEFEYLCQKGKGRVRLESTNGKDWTGTWEIPGGWGNLTLTLNPQGDSLRGRWWDPESTRSEDREGGRFQIMKVR